MSQAQHIENERAAGSQSQHPIVPEDDSALYDDSEDFISDGGSSTDSLTSSVFSYQYENGRRYHAYRQGEYVIPNDEKEQDRLNLHHHIFSMVVGGALYRAPISKHVGNVLDLGTGTGAWAIDMADEHPQAVVTGTDLSPIQPSWVPPNCRFIIDDFELEWNFSQPFDFIHARSIEGSVKDYQRLFSQAHRNLKPGGWFEVADATVGVFCDDESVERAPNLLEWRDRLIEASGKFGKQMGVSHRYKDWMVEAGFTDVTEEVYKVPYSPWPKDPKLKELGRYQQVLMLEALEAYSFALFTRVLGWTNAEIQLLLVGVRKELLDRQFHGYSKLYFVYGKKPE
ncbi:TAM domain methyltransferase, putative [Paecilomyces variotii No. 5]|uniref:TAM domain methyltransferase, putative n=1 Tax=Byssochlamys spectabilis (strain No. 5 / NBRC 109023) TaxID=1356009 RepID=V5HSM0_BYSSN|nr:TAM domain methyltransferase, putative [Paecilomyces variotii No. 5]